MEHINARNMEGIEAEFVETGAVQMDRAPRYAVIVDRISHDIPFYRAFLKHAAINGTIMINNPYWWSADDKFFNYTLAWKMGVAVPKTVIVPHKKYPEGTNERSMRNLEYPLDWDSVFAYVGEHGFLKPVDGGGWRDVYHIHNREEFFKAYDQSRDLCMTYQKAVNSRSIFAAMWWGRRRCTSCRMIRASRTTSGTCKRRRVWKRRMTRSVEARRAGCAEAVPGAGIRLQHGGVCG